MESFTPRRISDQEIKPKRATHFEIHKEGDDIDVIEGKYNSGNNTFKIEKFGNGYGEIRGKSVDPAKFYYNFTYDHPGGETKVNLLQEYASEPTDDQLQKDIRDSVETYLKMLKEKLKKGV